MVTPGPGPRVLLASLAWGVIACGLAAAGLFERLLADDAYYYFEIARNAALGQGLSFDSVSPTNGFHPLWAWLLVPLYALLPAAAQAPVKIALALSALCVPVTAVGIQRLLARLGAPRAGELAAYTWLLNPFTVVLAFRGVEAPLVALLLLVSVATLVRLRRSGAWSLAQCAWLGAGLGVLALARTDALLWAAVAAVCVAWDLARAGRAGQIPLRILAIAATAAAVALPWIVWNLWTFGTLLQTSAEAKLLFDLYGRLPPLAEDAGLAQLPWAATRNLLLALLAPLRFASGEEWGELRRSVVLFWLCSGWALAVAGAALVLRRRPSGDPTRGRNAELTRQLTLPLGAFVLLHLAAYAWLLRFYSSWYWLSPLLALCLIQGAALAALETLSPRRYALGVATCAGMLLAATALFSVPLFGRWPPERARGIAELGAGLPAGTRVGMWNSGEVGYFLSFHFPGLRVVNLDGLVNNDLTRAARRGAYEQYLLRNVDVLLEEPLPYLGPIVGPERAGQFVARHVRGPAVVRGWPVYEVRR
jgi:hypothetical protein